MGINSFILRMSSIIVRNSHNPLSLRSLWSLRLNYKNHQSLIINHLPLTINFLILNFAYMIKKLAGIKKYCVISILLVIFAFAFIFREAKPTYSYFFDVFLVCLGAIIIYTFVLTIIKVKDFPGIRKRWSPVILLSLIIVLQFGRYLANFYFSSFFFNFLFFIVEVFAVFAIILILGKRRPIVYFYLIIVIATL